VLVHPQTGEPLAIDAPLASGFAAVIERLGFGNYPGDPGAACINSSSP
jgi:hypothetical protein